MNKFNKCVFIFCIAALGSACKSGGGASTNADSLSSQAQGQEKWRSSGNRSGSYRSSYRSRYSNRRAAPAPVNEPSPQPAPEPVATPQPAPTPVVVRPEPSPAPEPTPIAQVPAPQPEPEPTPEPAPAPTVIGNAKLSWSIPTKRENGDSLPASELSRYEVYYTSESGKEDTIPVTDASQTSLVVENLESDTYHFAMVAVDQDGIISELSNSVPKTIE